MRNMTPEQLDEQLEAELAPRARKPNKPSALWFWRGLVILIASTIACGAFFYVYLRYAPLPPNPIANTSKMLASDGEPLTNLVDGGDNRIKVSLNDIPHHLVDATIAVEDQSFYHHGGFSPSGLTRALWVDLKSGGWVEGGSTITQQLAKNLFLTQEQTVSRKMREAALTLQLELNYSKDEILEQYLNVIYYGQGAYGIETAARTYFDKSAKDLDLAESAVLAGIPKGPSLYNPFIDYQKAKDRQKIVLDLMAETGKITKEQAATAYKEELKFAKQQSPVGNAPWFTDFASWQLKHFYGVAEDDLYRGGLQIQTTLDPQMQKAAEGALAHYLKGAPAKTGLQASLIAMDPQTGEIKAMVGGPDYAKSTYNRTLAKRQPGSSFKPFVYLTALNNRYTPSTRIMSEPKTFTYDDDTGHPKLYVVHNFADHYANDYITFREAIATSDNVYAVTTNMDVGPEKVMTTAKLMGIESPMKPYPSLALGVFPVSPLEMVRAYAVLANGGFKVEPHTVARIEDTLHGTTQVFKDEKTSIVDPGVAYILTDMMRSVLTDPQGTAYRVHDQFKRPAAAKTGTTDTDAWMIGYTPHLVTAVWVGYDKDRLLSATESHLAAPIWAEFMNAASEKLGDDDFSVPGNVVETYVDPDSGLIATDNCPTKQREYFLTGSEPTEWCTVHPSTTGTQPNGEQKSESGLRSFWDWVTGKRRNQ
jgi:penicillin-binding protein 2D